MTTHYFTFGQAHTHWSGGVWLDKDMVVAIDAETADEARQIMFDHFGDKWAFQYYEKPDMTYFPRGVYRL